MCLRCTLDWTPSLLPAWAGTQERQPGSQPWQPRARRPGALVLGTQQPLQAPPKALVTGNGFSQFPEDTLCSLLRELRIPWPWGKKSVPRQTSLSFFFPCHLGTRIVVGLFFWAQSIPSSEYSLAAISWPLSSQNSLSHLTLQLLHASPWPAGLEPQAGDPQTCQGSCRKRGSHLRPPRGLPPQAPTAWHLTPASPGC